MRREGLQDKNRKEQKRREENFVRLCFAPSVIALRLCEKTKRLAQRRKERQNKAQRKG
jgi:hypothetical protein